MRDRVRGVREVNGEPSHPVSTISQRFEGSAAPQGASFRTFVVLVCGYAVSNYGSSLNLVALSLYAFQVTGSAFTTSAVMALRLTSGFLCGLSIGRLAHRLDRLALMVAADLAQATAMVALVLVP